METLKKKRHTLEYKQEAVRLVGPTQRARSAFYEGAKAESLDAAV